VQGALRTLFGRRGLPGALRVDNGKPWGTNRDLPPVLALWLIGLGVPLLWNPPRQPQKNGVVERSQGTAKCWAEPECCDDADELQRRLEEADRRQREGYPYLGCRCRLEVFADLRHSGRPYRGAEEESLWRLQPVCEHLAGYAVSRRVDSSGTVSLYDRNLYVGVIHRGAVVQVMFDPHRREWLLCDRRGQQLRTQPAPEIEAGRIRALWSSDSPSGSLS
jgi:transposase InsO family protein